MKKIILTLCLLACSAGAAQAEVTGLTAKLKGGCHAANTNGSCTVGALASGSDFTSDSVLLQRADTANGRYKNVSATPKTLSSGGTAVFKFRNKSGCYRVTTAENGNDAPDVHSRAVCEK